MYSPEHNGSKSVLGDNGGDRDRHARGEEISTSIFFVKEISTHDVINRLKLA